MRRTPIIYSRWDFLYHFIPKLCELILYDDYMVFEYDQLKIHDTMVAILIQISQKMLMFIDRTMQIKLINILIDDQLKR